MAPPQTPAEQRAVLADAFTTHRRYLFETTGNGIHAWLAYRLSRHLKTPQPEWVLEYFDRCAKGLPAATSPTAIVSALGFPSSRAPRMAATDERDKGVVTLVLLLQEKDPEQTPIDIFNEVAERYGLSSDRVQNIFYERGCTLRQIPTKS